MHLTGALKVAEGPWHWGELSLDYALCKDGKHQSPARQEYSEPLQQTNVIHLLPSDLSYYRYTGSLTTPPWTGG